ncbi:MAG: bifunctional NAD(P)/FAD-dependent oxidoreductase/class I SAM-dependent methyltransferase [Actinomycetota bacterium]
MPEHVTNEDRASTSAMPRTIDRHCDVAVVGGSAAGLAAALQLVRQRRSVIVVDDGTPRNAPAKHMHGYLGWDGAAPTDLTARGRAEVRSYGGEVLTGRAQSVEQRDDGWFQVEVGGGHRIVARRVLAATGLIDVLPNIDGVRAHWGGGVIHCPFCHGYEVRDAAIVQIVTHPMGFHQAVLFRQLAKELTVVVHDAALVADDRIDQLVDSGVDVVPAEVRRIVDRADGEIAGVELANGTVIPADAVVVGPTFRPRTEPFAGVGPSTAPHDSGAGHLIEVDPTGQTSVTGVYAAGNATDPTMQVLQAAAHGGRVGAMIAFDLADDDLHRAARLSPDQTDWDRRYGSDSDVWSGNPNGTLVAEVSDLAPARVLDVGAGEGGDAMWLAERGWAVTASDVSERGLERVAAAAEARGLEVESVHVDVNELGAFGTREFELVSMQYGSIHRTPDGRALSNLLGAVAPGGTLLAVAHDRTPWREPVDVAEQTRMFDPDAFVGVDEIAAAIDNHPQWHVDVHETRTRPPGAASAHHHVDDVVLRAHRAGTDSTPSNAAR